MERSVEVPHLLENVGQVKLTAKPALSISSHLLDKFVIFIVKAGKVSLEDTLDGQLVLLTSDDFFDYGCHVFVKHFFLNGLISVVLLLLLVIIRFAVVQCSHLSHIVFLCIFLIQLLLVVEFLVFGYIQFT